MLPCFRAHGTTRRLNYSGCCGFLKRAGLTWDLSWCLLWSSPLQQTFLKVNRIIDEGVGSVPAQTFQRVGPNDPSSSRGAQGCAVSTVHGCRKVESASRGWHKRPPLQSCVIAVMDAPAWSERLFSARIAAGGLGDHFLHVLHFVHSSLGGFLSVGPEVVPPLPPFSNGGARWLWSTFLLACCFHSCHRSDQTSAWCLRSHLAAKSVWDVCLMISCKWVLQKPVYLNKQPRLCSVSPPVLISSSPAHLQAVYLTSLIFPNTRSDNKQPQWPN